MNYSEACFGVSLWASSSANKAQLSRLSEISGNLSLVLFVGTVLPAVLKEKEIGLFTLIGGTSLTLFSLFVSMWLIRGKKK